MMAEVREAQLPGGLGTLFVAMTGGENAMSVERPGNGGYRLLNYKSLEAARAEAKDLANGMAAKHSTFATGFAGAKLVCAANKDVREFDQADKDVVIQTAAAVLSEMGGKVYTGCDMNTTPDDMVDMSKRVPYVLAALPNVSVCPNTITGFGVFGAVEAAFDFDVKGKTMLVHGCGGVGSVVARKLVDSGANVLTFDIDVERANLPGCTNISAEAQDTWHQYECDGLVPCSASHTLTEDRVRELKCTKIVGATNLPFATPKARTMAEEAGITFIPESVSSAGAVIGDSIEHFDRDAFANAEPSDVYEFARAAVAAKTAETVKAAKQFKEPASIAYAKVAGEARGDMPIGLRFTQWVSTPESGRSWVQFVPGP
jgi:leucine dehydrogenase